MSKKILLTGATDGVDQEKCSSLVDMIETVIENSECA